MKCHLYEWYRLTDKKRSKEPDKSGTMRSSGQLESRVSACIINRNNDFLNILYAKGLRFYFSGGF